MKDITSNEDVTLLVDTFYDKARKNEKLGPIFETYIKDWDKHHVKLYQFWRTVILKQSAYRSKPVQMHFKMGLTKEHFDLWLALWQENVDCHFSGVNADVAKYRGQTMADAFFKIIERNK